jgi:hypothetical protein
VPPPHYRTRAAYASLGRKRIPQMTYLLPDLDHPSIGLFTQQPRRESSLLKNSFTSVSDPYSGAESAVFGRFQAG